MARSFKKIHFINSVFLHKVEELWVTELGQLLVRKTKKLPLWVDHQVTVSQQTAQNLANHAFL